MTTSPQSPAEPEQLVRAGPADARTASVLRDDLNGWLCHTVGVPPAQRSDIVVSAYEALANCADHAYAHRAHAGAMTLRAVYDQAAQAICVSIADHGIWQEPAAPSPLNIRGRGIALMRALADRCTIEGRPHGTVVRLHYAAAMTNF